MESPVNHICKNVCVYVCDLSLFFSCRLSWMILFTNTLSHDLSDPSSIDGAGWRSAGVPRIHPLTGDRKEGKKHLKEWITAIVMCTKRQILLENSLGVFYLLCVVCVQTLELNVPLLLTGWQRKVDCTCRNHRQWTHPWAHPSVESSGAPSPLQHTHTCMWFSGLNDI